MTNQNSVNFIDVVRLLGDINATTVERILGTGGSLADLEIAYFSLMGDNDRRGGQVGPLAGPAAKIFAILSEDPVLAAAAAC